MTLPQLSIVVCAYNMGRELPRSLQTLAKSYQRDYGDLDWEVIVLDNDSEPPLDEAALSAIIPGVRVIRPQHISQSPVAAINQAVAATSGQLIGLWIDGARMASPGMLKLVSKAWASDPTKAIGSLAFHLGPDVQMRSIQDGYDAAAEDALMASVPWQNDGYRLFDIAALAGSSANGWFGNINETNGLFMDRKLWQALGGLDERFQTAGGGFVNLDFWQRAVAASHHQPWMLLGEATFHQVHGGAATNGTQHDRDIMAAEYRAIHGADFSMPPYTARYLGTLDAARFAAGSPKPLDRLRHVHTVRGRHFRVDLPSQTLERIQNATLKTRYKGLRLAKNPFDLVLYARQLASLRPATLIEIGTSEGGSAVWLRDQLNSLGMAETKILTIDIAPPNLTVDGIAFYQGDAHDPEATFPNDVIALAPHPWLIIEDSAHSYAAVQAVLGYFDRRLVAGDAIVIEDGVLADLDGAVYRQLDDGPNRAVAEFLQQAGTAYSIDDELADFYGPNVTWAPNGWLRRN